MTTTIQTPAPPTGPGQPPVIDPMRGQFVPAQAGNRVPAGQYMAEFVKVEYIPPAAADPMTGKGAREWASFQFRWRIVGGEFANQTVTRDVPVPKVFTPKTAYGEWVGFVLGRAVGAEDFDLTPFAGKKYLVTIGERLNKTGQPSGWLHVSQCIRMPDA